MPSHGLSYTTFTLSGLEISYRHHKPGSIPTIRALLDVKNTGSVAGSEVLQLYISPLTSTTQRPVRELHGFEKVFLKPGEEKTVKIPIDAYATSFWDESEQKWCSEKGAYKVIVTTGKGVKEEAKLEVEKTRYWLGL